MIPPSRRYLLQSLCGGLSISLSGCLYGPFVDTGGQFDPEEHVDDWRDEPVRGRGDPIDVEQAVDTPPPIDEQCGWEAEDAVESAVMERADSPSAVQVRYTKSSELPESGWLVFVSRVIVLGPNGDVRQLPEIPFDVLRQATPHTVSMNVSDGDDTSSCRYDVYVSDMVQQMD